MKLLNFEKFDAFNTMRDKMEASTLGYFELFDPAVHLTGLERTELEFPGQLKRLDELRCLPDKTLALKNSRVILYHPNENWYRERREFPVYHLAYCSSLSELFREMPEIDWMATTKIAEDYDLLKIRPSGEASLVSHGFAVCKHCLHTLRYKDYDEFRNRRRGYSEKVLNNFNLREFYSLYQQYPLSFKSKPAAID